MALLNLGMRRRVCTIEKSILLVTKEKKKIVGWKVGQPSFTDKSCYKPITLLLRLPYPSRSLIVSFPGRACPGRLSPSADSRACFCGTGSSSWATLSLAAGLGVPCLVWLPGRLVVPARFSFVSLGSGWWFFAG